MTTAEPHEYVAAWGAQLGIAIFRCMSLNAASACGGWLGRTLGPRLKAHRHAERNLSAAMPELDNAARQRVLHAMWDNLGRVVGEYAHLDSFAIDTEAQRHQIEIAGAEHLAWLRDEGRPALFFSAHYGNWELIGLVAAQLGVDLLQVYRAANNPLTERLLQALRMPLGGRHVPKGSLAAREILRALRQRESVGMLVDQKLNTGIAVPFFGRDAMTAPAIAEFALHLDCPIIPARVERLNGTRFRVTIEAPIHLQKTGDHQRDVYDALLLINRRLEDWIRARPDHWFWVHKRWPKD